MNAVRKKKQVQLKDKTQNQINVLYPRKTRYGIWVFDDEEVGLQAEPFVGSINTMIDMFANGKKKVIIYISKDTIADETLILDKVKMQSKIKKKVEKEVEVKEGDEYILEDGWYQMRGTEEIGWLCPACLKYFPSYPDNIYVKFG